MIMHPPQVATRKGPTVATLMAIEEVLKEAALPMTRYKIRQALGNRISQPLLDAALKYMADHEMVYDEGPGKQVLWIRTSSITRALLQGN